MYAKFSSIGSYCPSNVLTNKKLEQTVNTTEEWILKRTGIRTRYIADKNETTSDMAVEASKIAIERANLTAKDLDLIICATVTPDYFNMPSTASIISFKLGIKNIQVFDISAACTGFIYALSIAKAFIESNMKKNILIIGSEKFSSIINYKDRGTCILFGDGAGASIISATKNKNEAFIDINASSDSTYYDYLMTPSPGTVYPYSQESLDKKLNFFQMKGNETFKLAIKTLISDVKNILNKNNIKIEDIVYFIPHQANYRIIKAVGDSLNLKKEQIILTIHKYGNTSAASIPMAINDIFESKKLKKGDLMLLDAFGSGLTWGSALIPFSGENNI